jgi:hypothetical protein
MLKVFMSTYFVLFLGHLSYVLWIMSKEKNKAAYIRDCGMPQLGFWMILSAVSFLFLLPFSK